MIIGNFKEIMDTGVRADLDKWYWGVEIKSRPSGRFIEYGIWPSFLFVFVRWSDFGEPEKLNGRPAVKKGGWKSWTFPFGISIKILK